MFRLLLTVPFELGLFAKMFLSQQEHLGLWKQLYKVTFGFGEFAYGCVKRNSSEWFVGWLFRWLGYLGERHTLSFVFLYLVQIGRLYLGYSCLT